MTTPLASQAAAVRHIHSIATRSGDASQQTLEWAAQGIRTLEWMADRPEVIKAIAKLFDTFPGAQWSVRDVQSN